MKKYYLVSFSFILSVATYAQVIVSTYESVDTVRITDALLIGSEGEMYGSDFDGDRVYKITADGEITTFASGLNGPNGLEFDNAGNVMVVEHYAHKVLKISPAGEVSTHVPLLNRPSGILKKADSDTMYVTQYVSNKIVKVDPDGNIFDFAAGDLLDGPVGLVYDDAGELYTGNFDNRQIIHVYPDGSQELFATIPGVSWLGFITYSDGFFYGTSFGSSKIYQVRQSDTLVTLLAGTTSGNTDGDTSIAQFNRPNGIIMNATEDSLFISDYGSGNVRVIKNFKTYASIENVSIIRSDIRLYPNPTVDCITVKLEMSTAKDALLSVVNLSGETQQTKTVRLFENENNVSFDISGCASGTYFISIQVDDVSYLKKFVVGSF